MPRGRRQSNLILPGQHILTRDWSLTVEQSATLSCANSALKVGGQAITANAFMRKAQIAFAFGTYAANSGQSAQNSAALPAGAVVLGAGAIVTTGMGGAGFSAARLSIGTSAQSGGFLLSQSVYAGVTGFVGANNAPQYSSMVNGGWQAVAATTALAKLIVSSANLSAMSAGAFTAEVYYVVPRAA